MIESNIYLEMILHTNLDLTDYIPLSNEKNPFPVESLPLDPVKYKFQGETPLAPTHGPA